MNDARLYLRYLSISVQSQLQYRVSFILMSVGHFFVTATEIFAIWVLFARFNRFGFNSPKLASFLIHKV